MGVLFHALLRLHPPLLGRQLLRRPHRQLAQRVGRGATFTAERLPVELTYSEAFSTKQEAVARERQLKRWTRAKNRALVEGNQKRLHELSQRRIL